MFNSICLKCTTILFTTAMLSVGNVLGAEKKNDVADELTMEFVRIPAGSFQMGSLASEKDRNDDEGPAHEVKIDKPFYMGKDGVIVRDY